MTAHETISIRVDDETTALIGRIATSAGVTNDQAASVIANIAMLRYLDARSQVHSPAPDSVSNGGEQTRPSSPGAGASIDALAQEIRRVDGRHSLGAAALAEALMPFIAALQQPSCITRDVAIYIARLCAYAKHDSHSYLPQTRDDAKTWQPHEWVIDAIRWADAQPDEQP